MARPVGKLNKKGRYSKGSIYAAVMEQLEYWQAIEDGAEIEEEPKKKKKTKKEKDKKDKEKKDKKKPKVVVQADEQAEEPAETTELATTSPTVE